MPLSPGLTLGPYEITGLLGVGGMGEVYRAIDSRLRREVAIKVLPSSVAHDVDRIARFEQEARATAALNHPNIVAVYDVGSEGAATFVVSELLNGATLRERLREGRLPLRKVLQWAADIVNGLAAAHERGIAHRDLKPDNIFVTADGPVKILDFGLAKLTEAFPSGDGRSVATVTSAHTAPGLVLGTAGYMAPEQVRGLSADHRADIFAFGAILYETLAGSAHSTVRLRQWMGRRWCRRMVARSPSRHSTPVACGASGCGRSIHTKRAGWQEAMGATPPSGPPMAGRSASSHAASCGGSTCQAGPPVPWPRSRTRVVGRGATRTRSSTHHNLTARCIGSPQMVVRPSPSRHWIVRSRKSRTAGHGFFLTDGTSCS